MALVIGAIAQKGGVGKSTIARAIAREYAANEWAVKLADMDLSQGTSFRWHERRLKNGIEPGLSVEQFRDVRSALKSAQSFDLLVFDGAPHSDRQTLDIAKASALVVIPTGISLDDLEPTVRLANELRKHIPVERIAVALCRVGDSEAELSEAVAYLKQTPYFLFSGFLPERTGYRRASDMGRTATETNYRPLNRRADEFIQALMDRIEELS